MSKRIEALYDVTFRCTSAQLGTVMDVMKEYAHLVGVTQFTPPGILSDEIGAQQVTKHYHGGKRNKGIKGIDLLREILKDGNSHTNEEIGTRFVAQGFARNSASPIITYARREGWCTALPDFNYILTSALKAQGAIA